MSTNTNLSYLKVDSNILDKSEDGEYHVRVTSSTTQVNIEALAEEELAKVGIDQTGTARAVVKEAKLSNGNTIFNIIVTAEDGTEQTYKLNIERMSGNTDIDIYVNEELITKTEDKYIVKIGNDTEADVKVIAVDEKSSISIDGNEEVLNENSNTVYVTEEEKVVSIMVKAEDGTQKTHYLTLQRNSSDNSLLSITAEGVEEDKLTQTAEAGYQMVVSSDLTTLNLTVTTSHENAQVKIGEDEYKLNKVTKEISIPDDTNTLAITVKAENGEEKQYTLTIIKKQVLTLDSISVNGVNAEIEDGQYVAWINNDVSEANVVITPTSSKVNIKVKDTENTGTTTLKVETTEEDNTLKIIVKSPVEEEQVEYTLKIAKKSTNTELEYVQVSEQVGTLEDDGTYTVKVPMKTGTYKMEVKTFSPYASVKIEDNDYSLAKDTYDLDLSDVTEKQVKVTVKSQNGEEKQYTVNIEKISDDATLKLVKVNNTEITEEDGKYKAFVKGDLETASLYIEASNEKARIKLNADAETIHTVTKNIALENSEETVNVTVTAESGLTKTYTIFITKESADTRIGEIKVDEKSAMEKEENIYYVTASAGTKEVTINVTSANQYASVQINGSEKIVQENTIRFTLPEDTKIASVPIVITAQNGTDKAEYTLQIEKISNNTNIAKVKVNDKDVTDYDEETKTYTILVDEAVDEANVYAETENQEATIKIGTGAFTKHTSTEKVSTANEENRITITVMAEDGTIETRTLLVKKLSKDASIIKLHVNGREIDAADNGTYTTTILESVKTADIKVKATHKNAQIEINGILGETRGETIQTIDTTTGRQIIVPIKITAEDTTVTNSTTLTINIMSDNKALEYLKINNVEVEESVDKPYTYKAYIPSNSSSANVEIKTASTLAKVGIETTEKVQTLAQSISTPEEITTVYATVTAEDGSIRIYTIILEKLSSDSTLQTVLKNGTKVNPEDDDSYIINVSDDIEEITLKAIASNEFASVAIGEEEAEIHQTERVVKLSDEKTTTVQIKVTAQGGNTSTYTVTINKISSNTKLEYVKVGAENITTYDETTKTYETFIPTDSTSMEIEVKSISELATLEIGEAQAKSVIKSTIETEAEETLIDVKVTAENGDIETYYIKLIKISEDNTIKQIYVDNVLVRPDLEGNYIATVLESKINAPVKVIATNKYANIEIDENEPQTGESTRIVDLRGDRTKEFKIVVTSQSGEVLEKTLTINKVSDDVTINTVLVNGVKCEKYDATTKTYTAYIEEETDTSKVIVTANSMYSTVELGTVSGTGSAQTELETSEKTTTIKTTITSERGNVEEYWINITKKSSDASIEMVKVNDIVTEEPYKVNIKQLDKKVKLYVKATDENATVKIADEDEEISESTVTLNISLEEETIEIPVVITAQNGTKESHNITLTRKANNTKIKEILVNGQVVNLETFEHGIEDEEVSTIKVTTEDENAKVSIDDAEQTVNIATAEVGTTQTTIRTIKVTAQDGTTQEYSLLLQKLSFDTTLKEVYKNGSRVEKQEDGNYIINVPENTETLTLRAITNNENATVAIGDEVAEKEQTEQTIKLSGGRSTVVNIKVTSQRGTESTYTVTINKVFNDVTINTILVNDIEYEKYDERTKTYTAYIEESKNISNILVIANSRYSTVAIEEESGLGSVSTTVGTEEKATKVKVTVTSETGDVGEYWINIMKKSGDASIRMVKVNDVAVEEPYEVNITQLDKQVKLYVKATNGNAKVKIGDEQEEISQSTVTIDIPLSQKITIVPVVITAQDGTKESYNITLVRVSNDTRIKEILVNDKPVDLDTLQYLMKNEFVTSIKVTTEDENAKVSIDNGTEAVNVITEKVDIRKPTTKTIKVTAEDGTIKEYKLTLNVKMAIEGTITDENIMDKHIVTIIAYKTEDTREEMDVNDIISMVTKPDGTIDVGELVNQDKEKREIINIIQTNDDGSYEIELDSGIYDLLFIKPGYLSHRITEIDLTDGTGVTLDNVEMIGGDVAPSDEIEIDDLVDLNDNYGVNITEENKEEKSIYDLNGDGKVDMLDRVILKKNYGRIAEEVKWVKPNKKKGKMLEGDSLEEDIVGATIKGIQEGKDTTVPNDTDITVIKDSKGEVLITRIEEKHLISPIACDYRISSNYGYRIHPTTGEKKLHSGIDLVGEHHTEILTIADGVVTYAGVQNGYGNCIEIKHNINGKTIYSFYAHLSRIDVKVGEKVEAGDVIGLEGGAETDPNHGTSTGHHLHFEIRTASGSGHSVDPNEYIEF